MGRCVLALLASAWFAPAGTAAAGGPQRVGVVIGVRVNVPESRADDLLHTMERVLERELEVEVVAQSGAELERELPPGCATDAVCLGGLAARFEVEELLFLVVVGGGERMRVEFSRRHPTTGELSHPPALILEPDPEQMDRQVAGMVAQLLPDAPPRAQPEATPPVVVEPDREPDRAGAGKRTAGVILAGSGLAFAAGSIVLALRARSAADELNDRHPPDDPGVWSADDESLEDAHHRDRTWAAVLGVAGGVAIATGAVVYALGLRDRRRARDRAVSLEVAGGGGMLTWRASF